MVFGHVAQDFEYAVDLAPDGAGPCSRKECPRHAGDIPEGCPRWASKSDDEENFYCLRPKCLCTKSVKNALGDEVARTTHGALGTQGGLKVVKAVLSVGALPSDKQSIVIKPPPALTQAVENIPGVSSLPKDKQDIVIELLRAISEETSTKVYTDDPEGWDAKLLVLDASYSSDEMVAMMPKPFQTKARNQKLRLEKAGAKAEENQAKEAKSAAAKSAKTTAAEPEDAFSPKKVSKNKTKDAKSATPRAAKATAAEPEDAFSPKTVSKKRKAREGGEPAEEGGPASHKKGRGKSHTKKGAVSHKKKPKVEKSEAPSNLAGLAGTAGGGASHKRKV